MPRIVITGGSSGIGAAAARRMRQLGWDVVITGRSEETARLAGEIGCDHVLADFAKFRDVRALGRQLLDRYDRIDVLANNVGGVIETRQLTEDGHEKTLQVNHLSPFLLTLMLRPKLEESLGVVVNTSSGAHAMGRIDFDDLESTRKYGAWRAYGTAKLMNILHAAELTRRFNRVNGVSFHPGVVATGFAREGSAFTRFFYDVGKLFMIGPAKGADTLVWLATSPAGVSWTPGGYYQKRKPARKIGQASDADVARRLWDASEEMVGMKA